MKFFLIVLMVCILSTSVLALQETAGTIILPTQIGNSSYSYYGLINDGNSIINVSLSTDTNLTEFLIFPSSVILYPGNLTYVNITAVLPSNYTGGNITGKIYALQEGTPGQVKINVVMMKSIIIEPYGNTTNATSNDSFLLLGLISIVIIIAVIFIVFRKKKGNDSLETQNKGDDKNEQINNTDNTSDSNTGN